LLWSFLALGMLGIAAVISLALYNYGERSWRFRIESSDNIEVTGNENVTKAQIMEVMGSDIGRNIFFVPLAQQKTQLEQIPWVESASVMRFVPNRLQVEIQERTPVAFARVGPRIFLIDAGGTLMELPQKHKYSFPVILGMNPGEPLSTRVPRMGAYNDLVQQLDSGGAHYSQDLSEVDLSDLENLKVRVNDPQGDVLVELGSSDFFKRYKTYVSHVQEWRQQFQKLESVKEGKPRQAALTVATAKAAAAAGVKPAALTTGINPHDHSIPKPAFELTEKKADPKPSAKKATPRPKAKKAVTKGSNTAHKKVTATHSAPKASAASAHAVAPKPEVKKSAVAANTTTPKPSPAVAKPSAGSK
jgi:cell division protein FtsQ